MSVTVQRSPVRKSPRLNPGNDGTISEMVPASDTHATKPNEMTASSVSKHPTDSLNIKATGAEVASCGQINISLEDLLRKINTLERQVKETDKANESLKLALSNLSTRPPADAICEYVSEVSSPPFSSTSQVLQAQIHRSGTIVPSHSRSSAATSTTLIDVGYNMPQPSTCEFRVNNFLPPSVMPIYSTATLSPFSGTVMPSHEPGIGGYSVQPTMTTTTTAPPANHAASSYFPPNLHANAITAVQSSTSQSNFNTPFIRSEFTPVMLRKIPDLPEFTGLAEDWPIFFTAFNETTNAYKCTDLENNQRLVKALKGDAKETVKSLLIHPNSVKAAMEQLNFRYGRPDQLIRSQIQQIRGVAAISEKEIGKIIPFATKVKNLAVFLQSVNGHHHLSNPTLLDELVSKLPVSRRVDWARVAMKVVPYPTVAHFSDWISELANIICTVHSEEHKDVGRRPVLHVKKDNETKCYLCEGSHIIQNCKQFSQASVSERWKLAKKHRVCFSCLISGHQLRDCRRNKSCPIEGCEKKHHKLLHEEKVNKSSETICKQIESSNSATTLSCATSQDRVLFRILPVVLFGPNKKIETYALFDEGSSVSLMESELIKELGLPSTKSQLNLQWLGGRSAIEPTNLVSLRIGGIGKRKQHVLKNVYGMSNLNLPMQSLRKDEIKGNRDSLPIRPYSNVVPKLLIGLDNAHLGFPSQITTVQQNGPYAVNTPLGWIVFGPVNTSAARSADASCLLVRTSLDDIDKEVKSYFETESFGVKSSRIVESQEDVRAESILKATTKRVGDRFQTGLLWKSDEVNMPYNYEMALNRLRTIEKKMSRDIDYANAYRYAINDYLIKGYARKLGPANVVTAKGKKEWFLPHFAVFNPNKPSKFRLVFDAAAQMHGVSLNSSLLKGPQRFKQLLPVLFQFRENAIAVCGDIKEMFHQVLVQPEDCCAQRFLWREGDGSRDPEVYEMLVMTFGATCSPCAADYVKILNAQQHTGNSPRAIESIVDHHYIDDFVDSFTSVEEAIKITKEVKEIHAGAGFNLCQYKSSSPEVLKALGVDLQDEGVDWNESDEKILGLCWRPSTDEFKFNLRFHRVPKGILSGERIPTKREFLSVIMSFYDPMGFLSCFTAIGKLIMREVWRKHILWDEVLPPNLTDAWETWRCQLEDLKSFRVPRHYFAYGKPDKVELHIFVDASEDMFAAAAYFRYVVNEKVGVTFVCGKTRCAPLKPLSIPRLELQAAVLGTRLMETITAEHKIEVTSKHLWSDSRTVLKWIGSSSCRYRPFVAHRIAEILAATSPSDWRWIRTADNVADDATRASKRSNFNQDSRWIKGPDFLHLDKRDWPANEADVLPPEDDEELPPKTILLTVSKFFIQFDRFRSLNALTRTTAQVLRFVRICSRKRIPNGENGVTAAEHDQAEHLLVRRVQCEAFQTDIRQLLDAKPLKRDSKIIKLMPYLDEQAILRVYGRIDSAGCIPYSARRPIILPYDHIFSELVVKHYHHEMKHQNFDATIGVVRNRFWIIRLRSLLRKVISQCMICRIMRVRPSPPLMGPLPVDRLEPYVRPFTYTGLDYFGPVNVAIGRRAEKRWVALFTCLTIRAVHLEVAHDLSTDSCIIAIRNFINRRGVPLRMRSDNGTNFIGVNAEAKKFSDVFEPQRIQEELASRHVEWIFNCPANPSEGGVWERMVRAVKRVLQHTMNNVTVREHVFQSLLIEAENVVNSRPLTHIPVSVDQEAPLTPNDLLIGTANVAVTPAQQEELSRLCRTRKQWRIARILRDRFWKKWIQEYLPTLTRREKWCQRSPPMRQGDLVYICDANVPRNEWQKGIIEEVFPGSDGVVRRASVRISDGKRTKTIMRPASKLAVLDIE